MPAAAALPVAAPAAGAVTSSLINAGSGLLGGVLKLFGQNSAQKAAKKQSDLNYADANRQIDANMAKQQAWQDQMRGDTGFQGMMASAMGPQTSTTSSSSVEDSEQNTTQNYGAQQGTLDEAMQAAKNSVGTANVLQAQQLAALNRSIAGQNQSQRKAIGNIAAARGVDPAIASLGMDQKMRNDQLGAELSIAQQGRENTRGAWGDVNALLDRYKAENTKRHATGRSSGTTTGGPDIGSYLSMQQLLRPGERPVYTRQATA